MGVLPKSVSTPFGIAAFLRNAEFLREMNDPRFPEAQLQPEKSYGQQPLIILHFGQSHGSAWATGGVGEPTQCKPPPAARMAAIRPTSSHQRTDRHLGQRGYDD
jgi:hypothetical protein